MGQQLGQRPAAGFWVVLVTQPGLRIRAHMLLAACAGGQQGPSWAGALALALNGGHEKAPIVIGIYSACIAAPEGWTGQGSLLFPGVS